MRELRRCWEGRLKEFVRKVKKILCGYCTLSIAGCMGVKFLRSHRTMHGGMTENEKCFVHSLNQFLLSFLSIKIFVATISSVWSERVKLCVLIVTLAGFTGPAPKGTWGFSLGLKCKNKQTK